MQRPRIFRHSVRRNLPSIFHGKTRRTTRWRNQNELIRRHDLSSRQASQLRQLTHFNPFDTSGGANAREKAARREEMRSFVTTLFLDMDNVSFDQAMQARFFLARQDQANFNRILSLFNEPDETFRTRIRNSFQRAINRENSHRIPLILELFSMGTNQAVIRRINDIEGLLAHETDAQILLNILRQEANQNFQQILALYNSGLTSNQIQQLLQQENDATILNAQIAHNQANGGNGAADLLAYYQAGAQSWQITAMQAANLTHAQINQAITTQPNNVQPGNIEFVTSENGQIGSIYFPWGRIRLEHPEGPMLEDQVQQTAGLNVRVERYAVPNAQLNQRQFRGNLGRMQLYNGGQLNLLNRINGPVNAPLAGTLVEFYIDINSGRAINTHPSRGNPLPPVNLSQTDLNILYNVAQIADVAILQENPNLRAGRSNGRTGQLTRFNTFFQTFAQQHPSF